jgi:hypothetical protein
MADKKQGPAAAQAPEPETTAAPKFALDRLRKDCLRLFGVTVSTFDGAAFGLTGDYTVQDMRSRIDQWKNTRVTPAKEEN